MITFHNGCKTSFSGCITSIMNYTVAFNLSITIVQPIFYSSKAIVGQPTKDFSGDNRILDEFLDLNTL